MPYPASSSPTGLSNKSPCCRLRAFRLHFHHVMTDREGSEPFKVLFVCSQNRMRSLTAEKLLEGRPQLQARSAGTQPDARIVVTEGHLGWADLVICMEKSHLNRLRRKFPEAMQAKRAVCLHIPDDFEFMQPELMDELRAKLANHLPLP